MQFISIETELTTAFTDLILTVFCVWVIVKILRSPARRSETQRAYVWVGAFLFLAAAALFGFFAHGFELTDATRHALWQPLYLFLGLTVSLFVVGVIIDLRRGPVSKAVIAFCVVLGIGFYGITVVISGAFLVFILYEAVALVFALGAYLYIALRRRVRWAGWMALGIGVSIVAAGIQATEAVSVRVIWEFDHNGIFHIIQLFGVLFLLWGVLPERNSAVSDGE
jgi:hypothetical protein